ncbi:NAD(P)-binding protein [Xylariomycetidae sp. FL0641]|nr:NAD(P)-binding protein [Xylariomycetidae sp. FL0641]
MRGIQVSQYVKGPKELKVTELPDPKPQPDQYLIEVHAAAANFFDILQIQGKYQNQPPFPWTAGAEFAGTVVTAPSTPGARFRAGDRVFGASQGAYAGLVAATEPQLRAVPAGWTYRDAAGLFVTAPTSYGALAARARVRPGDWVLVHAAAGGVGLAAVQVAKALGAVVVATAGSARKRAVARRFGADHVVDYRDADEGWPDAVRRLTPGARGVDVVFDPVGLVDRSTKCVAWNGRILVVGFAAGSIEKVAMNKVLLKNISLVGIHWGAYAKFEPGTIPAVWEGIEKLIAQGKFKGTVFDDRDFVGLESVPDALLALGGRETWGKVVITIPQAGGSKL